MCIAVLPSRVPRHRITLRVASLGGVYPIAQLWRRLILLRCDTCIPFAVFAGVFSTQEALSPEAWSGSVCSRLCRWLTGCAHGRPLPEAYPPCIHPSCSRRPSRRLRRGSVTPCAGRRLASRVAATQTGSLTSGSNTQEAATPGILSLCPSSEASASSVFQTQHRQVVWQHQQTHRWPRTLADLWTW